MYRLTKMSADGFQLTSESPSVILEIFENYICDICFLLETEDNHRELSTSEQIKDLLWTPCGAEFIFEEDVDET